MNNSSSKKRVTRQDLKNKSKDKKVKNTRANEEGMKREKKKDREGKKMMLEWAMLKKMWKKKQENISSTSSEGQKEDKVGLSPVWGEWTREACAMRLHPSCL